MQNQPRAAHAGAAVQLSHSASALNNSRGSQRICKAVK